METDYYFNKLCWVCLAEENNMHSILDDIKIKVDSRCSPVSLCDLLSYVMSSQIFFLGGPYLICNNCKMQACAAYKFKKRCEISTQVFKKCGLPESTKETFQKKIKSDHRQKKKSQNKNNLSPVMVQTHEDDIEPIIEYTNVPVKIIKEEYRSEDETCNEADTENNADSPVIENQEDKPAFDEQGNLIYLEDPRAERGTLPQPMTFLCTICGLQKSRGALKQHMLRHANVRNHSCPFCERKFNDKSNLVVHMRIHTGVHPYVCEICGKRFIQATGLKIHKRVHDDVKPYKCHICNHCTRTSSALLVHIRRHNGVKNYHCDECDYAACSKSELKHHAAKHSDSKCHICKTCGKGFARRKGLKTHEKSHTGEKPYVCKLCSRGFTQAHSLRSHLRNIHKSADVQSNVARV